MTPEPNPVTCSGCRAFLYTDPLMCELRTVPRGEGCRLHSMRPGWLLAHQEGLMTIIGAVVVAAAVLYFFLSEASR